MLNYKYILTVSDHQCTCKGHNTAIIIIMTVIRDEGGDQDMNRSLVLSDNAAT